MATGWDGLQNVNKKSFNAVYTSAWSAGAIISTPTDMVRFYRAIFNTDFLLESSRTALSDFSYWDENGKVGLGIFLEDIDGTKCYAHGGLIPGFHSYFLYNTDSKNSCFVVG